MHLPAYSVNIIITIALVAGAVMGMLGGRGRLRPIIMSIYIGIVLANGYVEAVRPHMFGLTSLQTAWALLTVPVIIFGLFGTIQNVGRGSIFLNLIFGMMTGALLLSVAFMLMPLRDQAQLAGQSIMAYELQQIRPWLIGLMPIAALAVGFHLPHHKKK
jgi:hypothetical protein